MLKERTFNPHTSFSF